MDVIDIALKILREAGLPVLIVMILTYFIWRIGINARDAIMWSGPKFLIPIRDGIIENISFLSRFVLTAHEMLPRIAAGQEKVAEKVNESADTQIKIAKDVERSKLMLKALATVISHKCESKDCWFAKNKSSFDSDEFQ